MNLNTFRTLCTSQVGLLSEVECHLQRSDLVAQALNGKRGITHAQLSTAKNGLMD